MELHIVNQGVRKIGFGRQRMCSIGPKFCVFSFRRPPALRVLVRWDANKCSLSNIARCRLVLIFNALRRTTKGEVTLVNGHFCLEEADDG